MSEMNPKQREAAEFKEGTAVVIAIPGSGKTRTLTERICILVNEYGIPPESLLCVTFTKNAAEEMRSRLVPVLGDLSSRVRLSTIHSFCLHLLKVEGRVFEILSGKEQLIFIKDVMKCLRVKDLTVGTVLREISLAKNNIIDATEFRALFEGDKTMLKVADIYQAYQEAKDNKMLVDLDDLLLEAYYLLRDNDDVRTKYQDNFQSIMVDEWQDSNPIQLALLRQLIREDSGNDPSSFWVAGDDHQSIYSFTGASVGNILNFQTMFPGSRQFILDLNYRSTPQILRACQNLIQYNVKQIHKDLKTDNPDGDDVVVLEASNEETEALGVVNEIVDLVERRGYQYNDIAVLYRANFQSRYVEETFLQNKIPYHVSSGQTFYDRWEVRCLLDYLRVIHTPYSDESDEALLNILNVPVRYVSNKVKDQLKAYCRERGIHLYEGLKSMIITATYVRKLIKEFVAFMDPLIEEAENVEPVQIIMKIRATFDYDRFIVDEDIPSPDDVKINNINELQLAATRYSTTGAFLEYTDSFQDETIADDKEGVTLSTIHKVKGKEYPVVFVIGIIGGLLPSSKGNLEEERRIAYTALSRAMHLLFLSYPLNYLGQPAKKSIFLDEILGNRQPTSHTSAA